MSKVYPLKTIQTIALSIDTAWHYKLPLWFLGDIANSLFVQRQLKEIFGYRFKKVEKLFIKGATKF